jgi:signal transduction histidine kinase
MMQISRILNKKFIIFFNIAIFTFLLIVNILGFVYLRKYENTLKENFKQQILNLSVYWETIFHADELEFLKPGMEYESISIYYQSLLADMKERLHLDDIKILNPNHEILVDYTIDYRIGSPMKIDSAIWDYSLSRIKPTFQEVEKTGKPVYQIFLPLRNSDGKIVSVLYLKLIPPILVSLKQFKSGLMMINLFLIVIVILLGIISSMLLFRYLSLTEEQYRRERLAQLGEMSAIIAHEIRNPLGIIQGSTNLIKKKIKDPAVTEVVQFIEDEIRRLNQLINQLLQFVREPKLEIEPIQLHELLDDLISQFSENHPDIQFNRQYREALNVYGDRSALKQIFLNILQNAVHALEQHTSSGEIRIESEVENKFITISITNNGPSIPEEILSKIFQPFFTTRQKGSGLGLPISKMLLERMGGNIEIKNLSKESGVKVILYLPSVQQ